MSQSKKLSRTSWTKTTRRLAVNIVNGFPDRSFICPVFRTKHKIAKEPVAHKDKSVFFIKYRGNVYFLEPYYNREDKQHFYHFGLVEPIGDMYIFRNILDISDDTLLKYFYDTSGTHKHVEKIEQ